MECEGRFVGKLGGDLGGGFGPFRDFRKRRILILQSIMKRRITGPVPITRHPDQKELSIATAVLFSSLDQLGRCKRVNDDVFSESL
jgi:hypothetical protein